MLMQYGFYDEMFTILSNIWDVLKEGSEAQLC